MKKDALAGMNIFFKIFGPNVNRLKKKKDVKRLIKALRFKGSFVVRQEAASALGELRASDAMYPLIDALQDKKIPVRKSAAQALKVMGEYWSIGPLTQFLSSQELVDVLQDKDLRPLLREEAAKVLGARHYHTALLPLIQALSENDGFDSYSVREGAALALGALGDPEAIEALGQVIGEKEHPSVYREAMRSLGRMQDTRAAEILIRALYHSELYIRREAASALRSFDSPRVINALIKSLRDEDHEVRHSAVISLGTKGGAGTIERLIHTMRYENRNTQSAIAEVFSQFGRPAIDEVIQSLSDEDKTARDVAVNVLVDIGSTTIGPLIGIMDDNDKNVRAAAVRALGRIGDFHTIESLTKALSDKDDDVRREAVQAIVNVASDAIAANNDPETIKKAAQVLQDIGEPAVEHLINFVPYASEDVLEKVINILGEIRDPRAIEPLTKAMKEVDSDKVRYEATVALAKMCHPDAIESLVGALDLYSDIAVEGLRKIGNRKAIEALIWVLSKMNAFWHEHWSEQAAEALVLIGEPAVEPLIQALQDNKFLASIWVDLDEDELSLFYKKIIEILGLIGDTRAIGPLTKPLNSEDEGIQRAKAEALLRIQGLSSKG